ncbi:Phosphotransferase enzyme family protein [Micromonospora pattaloongensis]|uniref:Phosphotransferase enzyme family protein n=1 Tax=Micromonospora pattaloongensis TaxID=405436 RepID=A0A1H3JN99_9ACTN|nr:aminoglycoside phosphotransferase family protein [Micromonospora pattaloongensis]SDY41402.1 Phosphotransferase enzyme family protein [Micromonospora pattaloongensis]
MTPYRDGQPQARLTRANLDAVLAEIGRRLGLDTRDAQLIKFTNNAVFRVAHASIVVRIAGSATMRQRVPKIVQVARWLAEHDVPSVRLLPGVPQPLDIDGHLATVWQAVPETGPKPSGRALALILKRFHALPPPSFQLPRWNPLEEIRQRLAEPDGIAPSDLVFLRDRCDGIEEKLGKLRYFLPSGPIHGDPFLGNVIGGPGGAVICDFDSTSTGPREWDLVPVAVGKLRFDYARDTHGELVTHYGVDVTKWSGFETLRQVRELKLVTSVVPILRSNPAVRDQWAYRLETFRRGDMTAKWSTYV